MSEMNITNSIWVERYRPKKIEEIVLPDEYMTDFKINIQKREISHLLFSGPPGSGKTCVAQIFCSKYGIIQNPRDNVLLVDGSSKECRGITYVQDVIEQYLKVPPALPDKLKIVFIDEADQLTDASFKSLRHVMEKYSKQGRFILTCNYISKIEDAVDSRCQHYVFKQMPTEFVFNYCKGILEKESIQFDEKDVNYVISNFYPDIRKIVGQLQRRSATGKFILDRSNILTSEKILISYFVEVVNFIQNGEDHKINGVINNIVKLLGELDLDFRTIYSDLFFRVTTIPTTAKIIINKYGNSHNDCLLPPMHFMAMVFEVIQGLQKYKQLVGKK